MIHTQHAQHMELLSGTAGVRTMTEMPDGLCGMRRTCSAESLNGTSCGQVLTETAFRTGLGLQNATSHCVLPVSEN